MWKDLESTEIMDSYDFLKFENEIGSIYSDEKINDEERIKKLFEKYTDFHNTFPLDIDHHYEFNIKREKMVLVYSPFELQVS